MARISNWSDDYWLMLLQLYLRKPAGVKPMYSRAMVDLSLELHIRPAVLFARMCAIANLETPRIERIWQTYGSNPRRLARAVRLLRSMNGFNNADEFYNGVSMNETFERDFRPIDGCGPLMPVMLILVLDLYFRLTPATMAAETPEVAELARMMGVTPQDVADVMAVYRHYDPYLRRPMPRNADGRLAEACRRMWERFGNSSTEALASFAGELKEYFR